MTTIGPLEIRNPVILAAGPLGDSPDILRAAYNAGAGAVVTKSITLTRRDGNPEPTTAELDGGWHYNWVGLKNPGAGAFANMLGKPDYPVIVSLAGALPSDFETMVGMFDGVAGFELNISCPNTTEMIGDDPVLVGHAVKAAKRATDLPVFVKVGYGMDAAVAAAVSAGADGVTAINTVPGLDMARSGGLSGPPLLPMALWMIRRISSKYDIPIIGCGGISAGKDAAHHMEMGASAVQIGTAVMRGLHVLGNVASYLAGWSAIQVVRPKPTLNGNPVYSTT